LLWNPTEKGKGLLIGEKGRTAASYGHNKRVSSAVDRNARARGGAKKSRYVPHLQWRK